MIQVLTSFTLEIDDPRIAAAEILEQLDPEHTLLKNSAGLLFCSLDFVLSGAAEAVCKALPFEVIGSTTQGIAVPGAMDENMLAVMVLTSDEVSFNVGVSDPLGTDGENRVGELYKRLSGDRKFSPSLMLICHANPDCFPGDKTVEILDRISGGVPLFGINALNETLSNRIPYIEENGSLYCGSAIAKGAVLKLVSQIQEEVLHDSEHLAELIKKEDCKKNHLIFSCFGRSAPLVDL
ncbi:MAG: hypothetical protein LBL56_04500, partial [Treponema sp.]|nr:hypothetical protein [Treponema sp.]